ncbi:hypothetical protein I314_02330 [Cryptococcus bacillisporus CA1873]|uniref:CsbD-like domain-containing protein n=1 Tax=Cryptococcus bacillisporus CA1873 TaxID=1296111 RepID=A0ABR5BDR4_CRYGA|nr:hypothetical protein I314_02330 [Cryptococcus bacillisporus CA1873]|eukprot:KIR67117.1 hypothetical protein I314_02330 [Cryptococcus gattii CA1873]
MSGQERKNEPSQLTGQLNSASGLVQQAIGNVVPESMGASSWTQSGHKLQKEGQNEVDAAKAQKAGAATVDSGVGKIKSAFGYLTGDQDKQTEGNTQAEKAQWDYKQATSDSIAAIPIPSVEGVKGKLESIVGMATEDPEKQKEGNIRAEKAAWKDGV